MQEDKKGKTGFELSRGQLLLRVMRSAGTTLQQPSCDKQHREKTRKVVYRIIVSRGDWLGNQAKIKDENNGAVVYVGSSLTVHNPLFSVHKIITELSNAMFLLVNNFKIIGMLLNAVHDQVQEN